MGTAHICPKHRPQTSLSRKRRPASHSTMEAVQSALHQARATKTNCNPPNPSKHYALTFNPTNPMP